MSSNIISMNNQKNIILIAFFLLPLFHSFVNGQAGSDIEGRAVYSYFIDSTIAAEKLEREDPSKYMLYSNMFRNLTKTMQRLKFDLFFDEKSYIWTANEEAIPHDASEKFSYTSALIMATNAWTHQYLNIENQTRISQTNDGGGKINVVHSFKQMNWVITGRVKSIKDRVVQEARTSYKRPDEPESNSPTIIHAWYSTDLPFPFGPRGLDGLPGLILEVEMGEDRGRGFRLDFIEIKKRDKKSRAIELPKALGEIEEGDFFELVSAKVKKIKNN
jgi:GLPGLI family protein